MIGQRGTKVRGPFLILLAALLAGGTAAAIEPVQPAAADPFPVPPILQPNVDFWTGVFAKYSRNQSLVHSASHPERVYEVLDFRDEAAVMPAERVRALQARAERTAKARIAKLLRAIDARKDHPESLDARERRIYDLFAGDSDPARFRHAADDLRVQRGVREKMMQAVQVSGRYLPAMEDVFERAGLPVELTRLPLVESSFNEKARSSAGAAGVWQFIPSSARLYMRLNQVVDERVDPWASTEAAARHLQDDYALLGDWPLAITAYNHGRYGIQRGLKAVDGTSLADLVARYRGKRFGFASRNYYAEFVAALNVEREPEAHFGAIRREDPLEFQEVQTPGHYIPYKTLVHAAGVDAATFHRLNPAFSSSVVKGRLYVPPRHTVRLPPEKAGAFKVALAGLDDSQLYEHQRRIAKPHKKSHGKSHKRRSKAAVVKVARHHGKHRTHVVRSGQTLSGIATRYGVSLRALQKLNRLSHRSVIRPGQKLRIPRA